MIDCFILLIKNNKKFILTIFTILFILGIYSINEMQRQILPDLQIEHIRITINETGMSAEETSDKIIKPLEDKLQTLQNLRRIESYSTNDSGIIDLSFKQNTNMEVPLDQVNKLISIMNLNKKFNISVPKSTSITSYISSINITISGYNNEDEMNRFANLIQEEIESIPGVANVVPILTNQIRTEILINPEKIEQYYINPQNIEINENTSDKINIGLINGQKFQIKVNKINNIQAIKNIPIALVDDRVIKIKDIATVEEVIDKNNELAVDKKLIILSITTMENIDTRIISKNIRNKIKSINKPYGIDIKIATDLSEEINSVISDLNNTAVNAILAIIVVVSLFLGLSNGLIISLIIPVSVISSFFFFFLIGQTINVLSLIGVIISIGIIIDNAILVVEEAYANQLNKQSIDNSYINSIKTVYSSIISSTLTTIVAFIAITFSTKGMMTDIANSIIVILLLSMIVSLTLIPLIGINVNQYFNNNIKNNRLNQYFDKLEQFYVHIITTICSSNKNILKVIIFSFLGSILLPLFYIFIINPNIETHVKKDNQMISFTIIGNDIYSEEEKIKIIDDIKNIVDQVSRDQSQDFIMNVSNNGNINIGYGIIIFNEIWNRKLHSNTIIQQIKNNLKQSNKSQIKEIVFSNEKKPVNLNLNETMQLIVTGSNTQDIINITNEINTYISTHKLGYKINSPIGSGLGSWIIELNEDNMVKYGLNKNTIAMYLKLISDGGIFIGKYNMSNFSNIYMNTVMFYPEYYRDINQLKNIKIPTKYGLISSGKIIDNIKQNTDLNYIQHDQRKNISHISFENISKYENKELYKKIKQNFNQYKIFELDEYSKLFESEQDSSIKYIKNSMLIGILGMFLILLAQFNSFCQPMLILTSILFSITGVIIGYIITGSTPIITMTGLAFILLSGIVINDNIILISTYNQIIKEINDPVQAIILTGKKRLKPVILTSLTTVIGLLPSALKISINFLEGTIVYNSPNNQWIYSLAMPIIFGVSFDTIITLIITPAMILGTYKIQKWLTNS